MFMVKGDPEDLHVQWKIVPTTRENIKAAIRWWWGKLKASCFVC
jgi:hypothetical protein